VRWRKASCASKGDACEVALPRSSYDVVIVGRDLAGTVAGALLSLRGLRVLAIASPEDPAVTPPRPGQQQSPQDRYTLGPYVLPTAPMAFVGAEAPAIHRLVAELNLVQIFRRRLEPNRPSFQLLFPDARIDVDDELYHALERELPGSALVHEQATTAVSEISQALDAILQEEPMLPPEGFWDRRDGKRVASRLPDDTIDPLAAPFASLPPTTVAILRGLHEVPARFASDLADPGAIALARASELWRRGSFRIDGGREGLRALFLDRLRALGGEHRPELRVERLVVRRGRVVGVETGSAEGEIGAEHVVASMRADLLPSLFGDEKPGKRLVELASMKPSLFRYLLHFVVPLDVLPDALARVAFSVRDPAAPHSGANALMLHLQDGYGQHAVLTAEALTEDASPEALARLRKGVRAHVDALLPFVARHFLCVHSPNDGIAPEGVTETAPPPRPLEPLWSVPTPRLLGVCGLGYDLGIKGLLLAGRQTLPGLGVEGELEAALRVAKLVAGASKKRDAAAGGIG
jgi:phytoene dehydrogenase-like protein